MANFYSAATKAGLEKIKASIPKKSITAVADTKELYINGEYYNSLSVPSSTPTITTSDTIIATFNGTDIKAKIDTSSVYSLIVTNESSGTTQTTSSLGNGNVRVNLVTGSSVKGSIPFKGSNGVTIKYNSTDGIYADLSAASSSVIGGIKLGYTQSGKNYPVVLDSSNKAYVNVPWEDTNTTYSLVSSTSQGLAPVLPTTNSTTISSQANEWVLTTTSGGSPTWRMLPANAFKNDNTVYTLPTATSTALGGIKIGYSDSTSNTRNYAVQLSDGKAYVNVPWSDTNTTYSSATTSTLGLLKVSNKLTTAQTLTSSNGTTANRYYGVQMDSNGVAFVNVPWTDTTISQTTQDNWNSMYTWYDSVTKADTDGVINKWDEIVKFLDGVSSTTLNGLLENYVTTSTTQTIKGAKCFDATIGAPYGINLYNAVANITTSSYGIRFTTTSSWGTHGSVTGDYATYFTMTNGTSRGWIFSHDGTGQASISSTGVVTANKFVKSGGTSSQFLKADGSVDSTAYLPLSGGTMTGTLTTQALTPSSNNSYNIGTSSAKYNTVYATTFSGDLSGNAATATSATTASQLNGESYTGWCRADGRRAFGNNNNTITTAEFITMLINAGAFKTRYWCSRGSWYYAANQIISDTGVGNIHLAGSTVEVFNIAESTSPIEYTVRVHTPTTGSSSYANTTFVYIYNGDNYAPGWKRQLNYGDTASAATKLANSRTIWGQGFDGTANIGVNTAGQMNYLNFTGTDGSSQVGYIGRASNSSNDLYLSGSSAIRIVSNGNSVFYANTSGNVGIGTTSPSYKLHVSGTLGVSGAATFSSTLSVSGATTLSSTLSVGGALSVSGTVTASNVTSSGVLILSSTGTGDGVYLKYNNTDAKSIHLADSVLRPFGAASGAIDLGNSAGKWRNGTFSGTVTATTFSGALSGNATTATTATNANYLNAAFSTYSGTPGTGQMAYTRAQSGTDYIGNLPASNNANGILTVNTHSGNYYHRLGFSSDNRLYHQAYTSAALSNSATWYKIAYVTDTVSGATNATNATNIYVNYHTGNNTNYPLVWTNQTGTSNTQANQLYKTPASLYFNTSTFKLTATGGFIGGSFSGTSGAFSSTLSVTGATTLSSTLSVSGAATFSSTVTLPYAGGTWISMATRSTVLTGAIANSQSSAHSLYKVTSYGSHVVSFGGLGTQVGFYGFYASRVSAGTNGYDWRTTWETSTGELHHSNNLSVAGATTLSSTLKVTGATTLSSTLSVSGAATLSSTLSVGGKITGPSSTQLEIASGSGQYIDLRFGNSDTNAVVLRSGSFGPRSSSHGYLELGNTNYRWTNGYFSGTVYAGTFSGALSGNATTATTWATARTLTIGSTGKSVNGSGNVSWTLSEIGAAASSHTHDYIPRIMGVAYSTSNSDVYSSAAMQIRELNLAGSGTDIWATAPRLAWYWSGKTAAQIGLGSNGYLFVAPNAGTKFYKLMYESGTWGISITGSSASCTGNAATATALTTSAGSSTQPVYFSSGKPVTIDYTIATSVPSGAVFTDTKNTAGSTSSTSKLYLIGATSQAANPQTYSHANVYATAGAMYATSFNGTLNGTVNGSVVVSSSQSIKIGDATITWDATNGRLTCDKPIYAGTFYTD